MALTVKCDGCYSLLFNGKKIFCDECLNRERKLKQKYEKELDQKSIEIASLRSELSIFLSFLRLVK